MSNNEMTKEAREGMTFLDGSVLEKTIAGRSKLWIDNAISNRKHYKLGNPPVAGLAAFIVAAGPSLKKNAAALRVLGKRGVIICVEAAFRYLMEQGVTPEYCMCVDGDERMLSMIVGADTSRTTLITMASSSPALIDAWKGPKFFLRCLGGARDIDEKLVAVAREVVATRDMKAGEILHPLEDLRVDFPGLKDRVVTGGNVTGAAHSFALDHMRASHLIFVGADYSWNNAEEFYAGGAHKDMGDERQESERMFTHSTPEGEVCTNFSMFSFKRWHEDYAAATGLKCINASEGGILGVNRDGKNADGWEHLALADAVARYAPL